MSLTPNFGLTIPDAGDIVNLLTQCYPNFTLIDTAMQAIKETGVTTATETKSGTTHQIVRTVADCNVLRFTATSNFVTADTFTVDGVPVVGVAVNGTSLQTGDFVINSDVMAILNGGKLTLLTGGSGANDASDVSYNNTGSGLTATDVQQAIDELKTLIGALNGSDISYDNTGSGLTATDVQQAIDELKSLIPQTQSVQVVGDGVKTYTTLLDELYALIDSTKINAKSVFLNGSTIAHAYGISTNYDFTNVANSVSQQITIKATGSTFIGTFWNGSTTNYSTGVVGNGVVLKIIY